MSNKNLVIVESPAKAKTIAKFLGKDYVVKSSFGHIRDLPKKGLNIDINDGFKPSYEVPADKKKVVSELKKEAKLATTVWLASDEDREGEAIAWHLSEALSLKPENTERIVFHEITETAIKQAIAHPRKVDIDLVNAQQARRVLDRLVGYELSPILWKKIQKGLSAGRVQSVAVRLIVEREREIRDFDRVSSFKVTANFLLDGAQFEAELKEKLADEAAAKRFLETCKSVKFRISEISEKPSERNPSPPFTTSTLQQEAARKLGFSVKQTMVLAQKLYENGHITYMRTDSMNLSTLAIKGVTDYVQSKYGDNYLKVRHYHTKLATAQEAHEAIRPTNLRALQAGDNDGQQKLYQLIWRRTLASQMAAAKTLRTEVTIAIDGLKPVFIAKGEVLKFDGYLKVYGGGKDDSILPSVKKGDTPEPESIVAHEVFSRPPARYSEASLVKALEELGIGRPSTYAPTISTIQTRGYIEKADLEGAERPAKQITLKNEVILEEQVSERHGADKDKLLPTAVADVTTDFLTKYFASIIDSGFTALVEEELDKVAEGKIIWQDAIGHFYKLFHPLLAKASDATRQEASQQRHLGDDPKSKKPVYARFGRYGPMLQLGDSDSESDENKPQFAPLPANTTLDSVTLEQALKMFELPRIVGKTEDGQDIKASIGRFGPYIQIDKLFVSIKPLDPFSITETEARELYVHKLNNPSKKVLKAFDNSTVQVIQGPYGPYATDGKKNARIPKSLVPLELTLDQAKELLLKSKPTRKRLKRQK
jgi:DNA topoisomerase I